jgi:2-polyprenyl-3-methyl-5-hydroxy-6-metoxy-1,4-benzoquinol methylase
MPFDEKYFSTHTYANITFAKYSMYWWSNRFQAMLARRYGKKGARLLEVGSGMGHLVGDLEDTFETYGMDLNHWAVKQSKAVINKTSLETASAQELPFKDGTFNVVIIKHIVEHLPDPEKAIREIGRVTEKGGTLILATPNLDSLLKPWKGDKWIGYQDPTHISLKRPAEWLEYIRSAGFQPLKFFSDGFLLPTASGMCLTSLSSPDNSKNYSSARWADSRRSRAAFSCRIAGARASW